MTPEQRFDQALQRWRLNHDYPFLLAAVKRAFLPAIRAAYRDGYRKAMRENA